MKFPKMLYRSGDRFPELEAFKRALASGAIETCIVESVDEQAEAEAEGWTEDLAALTVKKRGRPRNDGSNTPEE